MCYGLWCVGVFVNGTCVLYTDFGSLNEDKFECCCLTRTSRGKGCAFGWSGVCGEG